MDLRVSGHQVIKTKEISKSGYQETQPRLLGPDTPMT
jgi:hypothetical protein